MACGLSRKEFHEKYFDASKVMEMYVGQESGFIDDSVIKLFPYLMKAFSSAGGAEGGTLIAMSVAHYIHYCISACDYFTEIIIAGSHEKGVNAIKKWCANEPGAIDLSHSTQLVCELQGKGEAWIKTQDALRGKVKQVLTYDVFNSNPLSPAVLPPADCLLLSNCLECHAEDREGFSSALRNVSSLLKKGGKLIMTTCLEQTFYMVGDIRFPHLYIQEDFVTKAVLEAGYVIEELQVFTRTIQSLFDVADYTAFIFINARKET